MSERDTIDQMTQEEVRKELKEAGIDTSTVVKRVVDEVKKHRRLKEQQRALGLAEVALGDCEQVLEAILVIDVCPTCFAGQGGMHKSGCSVMAARATSLEALEAICKTQEKR